MTGRHTDGGVDPRVLGRLLSTMLLLEILPTEARIGEFLEAALRDVLGVARCQVLLGKPEVPLGQAYATGGGNGWAFVIESDGRSYGALVFEAEDEDVLSPYRPFLSNLTMFLALLLENRWQRGRLVETLAELRASTERYRQSIELTGQLGWSTRADGQIEDMPAWRRFTGQSLEEVKGWGWLDALHPDDRERAAHVWRRSVDSRSNYEVEYRVRRRDGVYRYFVARGVPVLNAEGSIQEWAGVCIDITERRQAEEALRESDAKHSSMIANISDVIGIMGADGIMKYASPNIEKWFGWQPQDLVGTDGWKTVHPDDRVRLQAEFGALLATDGAAETVEYQYLCKDGSYKPIELTASNLTSDPLIDGVLLNYHDISKRRRAEADYQTLFREMLDGFALHEIICDEQGEPVDYRFLAVNPAFESMTGLKAEDIVGCTVLKALPGSERYWIETYGKVALTGEPVFFESYSAPLEKYFRVTAFQPAPYQFACIFVDITERKRAEEERLVLERQLQQSQRLESLGVLAGGIAHDFNNILTSVLGNAELALAELSSAAPARENLLEITQASHRAAALARQMLAYSGRGQFVIEPIDLSAFIEDMLDLLRSTISKKALLHFDLGKDLPPLEGDPSQLSQVIMNLVINASEAIGDEDGVITISAGVEEYSSEHLGEGYLEPDLPLGPYLTLEVSDTGSGMDAETQERLFCRPAFFSPKTPPRTAARPRGVWAAGR